MSGAKGWIEAWSTGTAYAAFFLLALSLVLGPLRIIRGQNNPVHNALRRDVGISAGIAGIVHTVLGLQVHLGGDIIKYFVLPDNPPRSAYYFVATNILGLISALVLAVLVAISNNLSIRSIGLDSWKRIQRIAYVAAVAAIVHAFLYHLLEKRAVVVVGFVAAVTLVVIAIQARGWEIARRR